MQPREKALDFFQRKQEYLQKQMENVQSILLEKQRTKAGYLIFRFFLLLFSSISVALVPSFDVNYSSHLLRKLVLQ